MHKRSLFILLLLVAISTISNSQLVSSRAARANLISAIDSILQSQVNLDKIPGAVIEIKKDNQVIFKHAYGFAQKYDYNHRLLNPSEKMTDSHLFDIASLTKVIGTTTSIMLLADRGLLKIEDPVYKVYKAF